MDTSNQNQPQVQQTIVVGGKQKSVGTAFLLAFLFGPLGLLYASVTGGIVMFLLGIVIGIVTFGLGLILVWIGSIIWAVVAASNANQNAAKGLNINTSFGGQQPSYQQQQPVRQQVIQPTPQPTFEQEPKPEPIIQPTPTIPQQTFQQATLAQTSKPSFDLGQWFDKNKKSVFVSLGGVVTLLILFVAAKFVFNLDFSKKEKDNYNTTETTQTTQPYVQSATSSGNTSQQINSNGRFPEASDRLLTPSDIYNLSKSELKIMRNEIYARHGYIFQTRDMKSYFEYQSWYLPRYTDINTFLSEVEKSNIELIKRYE